jgi:hypothetical protein
MSAVKELNMSMEHQRYDTEEENIVKEKPVSVPFYPMGQALLWACWLSCH